MQTSDATSYPVLSTAEVSSLQVDGGKMGQVGGCEGGYTSPVWYAVCSFGASYHEKKKSQFIFFITLLCLKDSAQMHVGSVLVLALIRNYSVKKTSSWCTTSDTQLEYFHVDFCQECFLKVADYFWALKDLV